MTYPDGRHAERPTGTAQPYLQDRQRWTGEPDRPNWPDEAGRPARPGEPDRPGWNTEPEQRGWNGAPDQRGWNTEPDQRGWNAEPDPHGWADGTEQRGWNPEPGGPSGGGWNPEPGGPSGGGWLDGPDRPESLDGLDRSDRLGNPDRLGGGPDRPEHLGEPDRRGGWLGEWDRTGRPAEADDRQQWSGQPGMGQPGAGQPGPGQAGAEPDPWFPRQRPPADVPAGAYADNDWLSPPRTGWEQHTQAAPPPEARDAPSQPVSFTAGEEAGLPALLRGRALDRLIAVNASHASHAADKVRTKDDLGEHAIALFSFDLTDKTFPLSTATRLSLSDDGNSNLVDMLTSLANVAEHKVAQAAEHGRRWDPRIPLTGLVNRSEPLSEDMVYLGIGVSTLDTPEMTWRSMKGSVDRFSGLHLRGQGYLYLDDRTAGHFVRAAQLGSQTGQHEITANNMLFSHYSWKRRPDLMEHANQRTYLIWEQIKRLHEALKIATAR